VLQDYGSIADFIKCKEKCFFCDNQLQIRLTNFVGVVNDLPIINAPIRDNTISFPVENTTASFELKARGKIDIRTNALVFLFKEDDTPTINDMLAKDTFLSFRPHMQLYCSSRQCKYEYTVASNIFQASHIKHGYLILPFKLYYESFVTGSLWVQNDYNQQKTHIFTRNNPDANPITVSLMNFETMGETKLLMRVKTLVVFS
jgi:hypothetical protein